MSKIPLLFEILKERKISQTKLSKDTGLSSGSIGDWKSGRSKPSHNAIRILCEYLDLPLDFFDEDKKIAPGESTRSDVEMRNVEMIAVKATEKQWTYILNKLSQENRDKLQEQAELLLLKQQVQADQEEK